MKPARRLWPGLALALAVGPSGACVHAHAHVDTEAPLPGVQTEAVLGMGNGTGLGIPAAVGRALASPQLRAYIIQTARRPASHRSADQLSDQVPAATAADDAAASGQTSKELPGRSPKADLRAKFKERPGYPLSERGGYKMSCYWLAWEGEYASEPYDTDIYNRHGFRIGRFPRTYVFELKMEGSGILRDGRVLNYDGVCGYGVGTCFTELNPHEHPLGTGGQRRALLPFKSVAVDPRFVPLGTTLYVPELRGLELPDGTRHDGCVRADDTGGNIRRHELDFFVESYENYKLIEDRLWNDHRVTPHIEEPRCDYLRTFDQVVDRKSESTDWRALHGRRPPPKKPAPKPVPRPQKASAPARLTAPPKSKPAAAKQPH